MVMVAFANQPHRDSRSYSRPYESPVLSGFIIAKSKSDSALSRCSRLAVSDLVKLREARLILHTLNVNVAEQSRGGLHGVRREGAKVSNIEVHRGDTLTYRCSTGTLGLMAGLGVSPSEAYVPGRDAFSRHAPAWADYDDVLAAIQRVGLRIVVLDSASVWEGTGIHAG
jgi:hypothetical protein